MVYTNYNERMRYALRLAVERGISNQDEMNECIKEAFATVPRKDYHNDGSEPTETRVKKKYAKVVIRHAI